MSAASHAILAHRPEAMALLDAALRADPGLVAAHAVAGLQLLGLVRQELAARVAEHLRAARAALRQRGGTAAEQCLVAALACWHEHGDMWGAAWHLDHAALADPLDPLPLKLSHSLRFMLGDAAGMRALSQRVLPAWSDGDPGFGFVLGCHAFALEETGDRAEAERTGRRAVELEPEDLWGCHAVAHVMEGEGRARDGLRWLAGFGPVTQAVGFGRHLFWHAALFHLHLGEGDAALALYDGQVWAAPSIEYRDIANAASLLWRLEAQGMPVGHARWEALADLAEARLGDHGLAFADLHHALSLARSGRWEMLRRFRDGMRRAAFAGRGTQAHVMRRVGLPLAGMIAGACGGEPQDALEAFEAAGCEVPALGGSHAQRDLFDRMALRAAAEGCRDTLLTRLGERATRRAPGPWEAGLALRAAGRTPRADAASDAKGGIA